MSNVWSASKLGTLPGGGIAQFRQCVLFVTADVSDVVVQAHIEVRSEICRRW